MTTQRYNSIDAFASAAVDIVNRAAERGLTIRIAGGLGCWVHSPESHELFPFRGTIYSDIDIVALAIERASLLQFLKVEGFLEDRRTATVPGLQRALFINPRTSWAIDVSYDVLEYNHRIKIGCRIAVDYPTLSPSDLLLQKLQIVEFTQKDFCDAVMLLLAHEVTSRDGDTLNSAYFSNVCSSDWGFWRTATKNLQLIELRIHELPTAADKKLIIRKRLESISNSLHYSPKNIRWRLRAIVGDRLLWYSTVDRL